MIELNTGERNPMYGKHFTEERKIKSSLSHSSRRQVYIYDTNWNLIDTIISINRTAQKLNLHSSNISVALDKNKKVRGYYIRSKPVDIQRQKLKEENKMRKAVLYFVAEPKGTGESPKLYWVNDNIFSTSRDEAYVFNALNERNKIMEIQDKFSMDLQLEYLE